MPSSDERLAKLETKQDLLISSIKEHMDREEKDREHLLERLRDIETKLARQKGFIGGVVFVVSAVWAVVLAIFKFKIGGA